MINIIHPCLKISDKTLKKFYDLKKINPLLNVYICTPNIEVVDRELSEIFHFVKDEGRGVYYAINKAIEVIEDGWIQVIGDSDESFLDENWIKKIENSSAEIILGAWCEKSISGFEKLKFPFIPNKDKFNRWDFFNHQACLIKKSVHKKIGLYSYDYAVCSDFDFLVRALNFGCIFETFEEPLALFSLGGLSSRDQVNNEIERYLSLRRNKLDVSSLYLIVKLIKHWFKNEIRKIIN